MGPFRKNTMTGIEVAEAEWRVTQVARISGGLAVTRDFRVDFGPLPDDSLERVRAKAESIRSALRSRNLRVQDAWLCLSKSVATVRYRQLPPTDSEQELAQMARIEAERHIPVNVEGHLIDYQVMAREELAGAHALTVAVDSAVMQEALSVCEQAGVDVAGAGISSLALYYLAGARQEAAAETPSAGEPALSEEESATVILHVGRASTDIVLMRDGVAIFTRNANVGTLGLLESLGAEAPASLGHIDAMKLLVVIPSSEAAASFRNEPLGAAEKGIEETEAEKVYDLDVAGERVPVLDLDSVPLGSGAEALNAPSGEARLEGIEDLDECSEGAHLTPVASVGAEAAAPKPLSGAARGIAHQWLTRLVQEVRQTCGFAAREMRCPPMTRILVSGAGLGVANLCEFLAANLEVQTEPLLAGPKPVFVEGRKERKRGGAEAQALDDEPLASTALTVGITANVPGGREKRLNLLPGEHLRRRRLKRRTSSILLTVVLALVALGLGLGRLAQSRSRAKSRLAALETFVRENRERVQEIRKMEFEIEIFDEFRNPKKHALHILDHISGLDLMDTNVRLTGFDFTQGETLELSGHAMKMQHVFAFIQSLERTGYFNDVQAKRHDPKPLHKKDVYEFVIACLLKAPEQEAKGKRPIRARGLFAR